MSVNLMRRKRGFEGGDEMFFPLSASKQWTQLAKNPDNLTVFCLFKQLKIRSEQHMIVWWLH